MTALTDSLLSAAAWVSDATPSPSPTLPAYVGNEDLITPTWVGFAITFVVAAATVFLVIDMVRRVRRVRYRGEIREILEAEQLEAERNRTTGIDPVTRATPVDDEPGTPAR